MDILVVNAFGASEPSAEKNLSAVSRDDTNFTIETIADVFPLDYNTYRYNLLKCANATVERIIKAEKEGFDGAIISCNSEPGLHDARSVVDIPVVGTMESACQIAGMMGEQFSIVQTDRIASEYVAGVVDEHGFGDNFASIRWIGIPACDLYPEKTDTSIIHERTVDIARKCIQEDRAEVIIPGCTILGAILTDTASELLEAEIDVPVIDPMHAGLKMCETMVDLQQRAGYPSVSRVGKYRQQPQQEFEELRQWSRANPSPEHHYIEPEELEYDEAYHTFVNPEMRQ